MKEKDYYFGPLIEEASQSYTGKCKETIPETRYFLIEEERMFNNNGE